MKELPLILFAVLSQAAAGLALVTTLLPMVPGADKSAGLAGALRTGGRLVFPLTLLAIAASFFHLGDPFGGYRVLNNLGSSWMSNEVALVSVFAVASAVLFFLWQTQPQAQGAIRATGLVTALVGLALVFATGMIYQLRTRPEWTHWANLAAGFVTVLLLGALIMGVLALWKTESAGAPGRALGYTALAAAALLMVSLLCYGPYLSSVSPTTATALFGSALFWGRLALGIGLPVFAAAQLVRGQQPGKVVLGLSLCAAVVGELVSRALFYSSVLDQLPLF